MEHTPDSPEPPGNHQANTDNKREGGTIGPKGFPSEANPVHANSDTTKPTSKPNPSESFMRAWSFITKPEHANAIMAIFTVLIFIATSAYAVIALLQWSVMSSQLAVESRELDLQRDIFDLEHGQELDVSMGMLSLDPQKSATSLQIKPFAERGIAKEIQVDAIFEMRQLDHPPLYAQYDTGAAHVITRDCTDLTKLHRDDLVCVLLEGQPKQWPLYLSGQSGLYVRGMIKFHNGITYQKFRFCRYISRDDYAATNYMPNNAPNVTLQRFSHACDRNAK